VWNTQYRNLADIVHKLVHKGSKLFIEGKIRNRSYDTREGIKKYITEIVADNIMLLDPKPQQSQSDELPAPEPIDFKGEFSSNMSENDIPF
jgi:single-strand DNA-binding protein